MEAKFFLVIFLGSILMINNFDVSYAQKPSPSPSATDSEALIDGICKNTTVPPFCVDFLHSDPRFARATAEGLAKTTILKAKANATSTARLIGELLKNPQNPALEGKLKSCMKNIFNALAQLDLARSSEVSSPRDLNHYASAALSEVGTCDVYLGAEEPQQLKAERKNLDNIIRVLLAISNKP